MEVCPQGALTQRDIFSLPEIDGEKCVLCGECIDFCPKGALEVSANSTSHSQMRSNTKHGI
ncbi:MAG: 4Fe-4S binding protein [Gracilibacteraceae bacterium]|nr:4Fe-4S binding protein [Gracilibacteraceae bacterium]